VYLVVGLGNPGRQYSNTRHNIGFNVIDYLCEQKKIKCDKSKFNALYGEYFLDGHKVLIAKPLTFMNRSGQAVLDLFNYYKISLNNLIIIYDDVDLDTGKLRIRPSGSSGTHNGMKSVIYQLQSEEFARIRIGIGKNPQMDLADYVLQAFSEDEKSVLRDTIKIAADAIDEIILKGIDSAMNKFNIK
jgi:peptidyl-tRNA hydrolase, PTH1 family